MWAWLGQNLLFSSLLAEAVTGADAGAEGKEVQAEGSNTSHQLEWRRGEEGSNMQRRRRGGTRGRIFLASALKNTQTHTNKE